MSSKKQNKKTLSVVWNSYLQQEYQTDKKYDRIKKDLAWLSKDYPAVAVQIIEFCCLKSDEYENFFKNI